MATAGAMKELWSRSAGLDWTCGMATVTRHAEALLTAAALRRGKGPWIEATKHVVAEMRLFQLENRQVIGNSALWATGSWHVSAADAGWEATGGGNP